MGSCVCVNPGRLAKGTMGGTFCTIDVGEKRKLEKAKCEENLEACKNKIGLLPNGSAMA